MYPRPGTTSVKIEESAEDASVLGHPLPLASGTDGGHDPIKSEPDVDRDMTCSSGSELAHSDRISPLIKREDVQSEHSIEVQIEKFKVRLSTLDL